MGDGIRWSRCCREAVSWLGGAGSWRGSTSSLGSGCPHSACRCSSADRQPFCCATLSCSCCLCCIFTARRTVTTPCRSALLTAPPAALPRALTRQSCKTLTHHYRSRHSQRSSGDGSVVWRSLELRAQGSHCSQNCAPSVTSVPVCRDYIDMHLAAQTHPVLPLSTLCRAVAGVLRFAGCLW